MSELDDNTYVGINLEQGSNAGIDLSNDQAETLFGKSAELPVVDALRQTHADYNRELPKWTKYFDTYESNDIYRFLYKHLRETQTMFDKRIGRGYYYNYTASVVDLLVSYLFHAPIIRTIPADQATLYEDLYKNADLRGTKYEAYMHLIATFAQIGGHAGVLVDMPQGPEGGYLTEADRLAAGHRPFLTTILPQQIRDWELDKFDNFEWVKLSIRRPAGRTWRTSADTNVETYVTWTRTDWEEWQIIDDQARRTGGGVHNLGEVPLVLGYNERRKNHPWFGDSAVRDISDINIAILNWCSLGDEEIFERCLNILTAERDENAPQIQLSQYNVLEYEPGGTAPEYLTPGATPLQLIKEWINTAKDEIYRLAKLGGSTGLQGVREATSGIAYAYEFNETNQSLAKKAIAMEECETRIHQLVAKWQGKEFEGSLKYPREFGVQDFLMEFQILSEGRANLTSKTAIRELERNVISKLYASESQELRDRIFSEIEKADPKMSLQMQAEQSFKNAPPALTEGAKAGSKGKASSDTGKTGKATSATQKESS